MKFIVALVLIIALTYAAFLYSHELPWWSFAVGVFLVGLAIPQKAWLSWLTGLLGVFICWAALAWSMDTANESLLSKKMAQILPLQGSAIAIILVTALVGGLVGSFAALTGTLLRKKPA